VIVFQKNQKFIEQLLTHISLLNDILLFPSCCIAYDTIALKYMARPIWGSIKDASGTINDAFRGVCVSHCKRRDLRTLLFQTSAFLKSRAGWAKIFF